MDCLIDLAIGRPVLKRLIQSSSLPYKSTIIGNKFTIGREKSSSLYVDSTLIKEEHCTIIKDNDKWKLKSHSSKTWLNGVRLMSRETANLSSGDEIKLGCDDFAFQFSFENENDHNCSSIGMKFNKQRSKAIESLPGSKKKIIESSCLNKMESKRGPKESCALDKSQLCRKSIVLLNQRARLNMRHRRNVVKEKKFENKYRQLLTTFQQFQKSRKRCSQELVRCHDAIDDKQKTIEFLCKRLCEYSAAYDNERIRLDNKYVKESFLTSTRLNGEILKYKRELEVERDSNNKLLSNTLADITGVLTKELECPICTEIMVEPAVTGCKHAFCSSCIITWLDKKKICALCKAPLTRLSQSLAYNNFIERYIELLMSPSEQKERNKLRLQREKVRDHPKWAQWFDSDSIGGIFPLTGTSALQRAYSIFDNILVNSIQATTQSRANRPRRPRESRNARRNQQGNAAE